MAYIKSIPADAGPPYLYGKYPTIYGPWSEMSEALMNGPSSLSPAVRELIFAYAAGLEKCEMVYVAHSEVAYARGIENGLIAKLLANPDEPSVEPKLRPLLKYVYKVALTPDQITQADADAVVEAGWDEQAFHDAIAIAGRAAYMSRLASGHGFTPMTREKAAKRAQERIKHGYVNLYPQFQKE